MANLSRWGVVWAVLLTVSCAGRPTRADDERWYKGQLHAHTYWSDGRGFPEQAVVAYKQRGFAFLSLTEHNLFATDAGAWRPVMAAEDKWPPKVVPERFEAYVNEFGKHGVESRTTDGITSVRLKTFAELQARFEEAGKFLLLPGVEVTQTLNGRAVHVNTINLPLVLPCVREGGLIKTINGPTRLSDLIALNATEAERAALDLQQPHLLVLNHPFWTYYDVLPQHLIDNPKVRFFDVCSGSTLAPHPQASSFTPEKFYDAVNAFRRLQGRPLLYGIGTDDAHFYDEKRINGASGVGNGWVMVRAKALTPRDLIDAMHRGDFYASTGVALDEVAFDPASRTLRVRVKPEPGINYTVRFITTKRNFDQKVHDIECAATQSRTVRTIPLYSEDVGRTVKTVAGSEASHRMEEDDLYVRARVDSDSPSSVMIPFRSKVKAAWTQPYAPPSDR